jgi:hypothetical protein
MVAAEEVGVLQLAGTAAAEVLLGLDIQVELEFQKAAAVVEEDIMVEVADQILMVVEEVLRILKI